MIRGGCHLIRGGNRFFVVVTAFSVVVSVVVIGFSVVGSFPPFNASLL